MSEMNEKVKEPQEQPSDRPPLREVSPEDLQRILEEYRKWVESEGKEGKKADLIQANLQEAYLRGANLQEANLQGAKLQGADLREVTGFTASQVNLAKNWELALYSDDFLKKLGLKPDHNERVEKKLAELEKEKKATGSK